MAADKGRCMQQDLLLYRCTPRVSAGQRFALLPDAALCQAPAPGRARSSAAPPATTDDRTADLEQATYGTLECIALTCPLFLIQVGHRRPARALPQKEKV